jgi:fructose-specific phosphotransferase system component IIB
MTFKNKLSVSLVCIFILVACSPSQDDAKKLGFENVEEMQSIQKQGYKSKEECNGRFTKFGFESLKQMEELNSRGFNTLADFKNVKELTPDFFYDRCKSRSVEVYESNCLSKRISWFGEITNVGGSSGAKVQVLNDDGTPLKDSFAIDSKSLDALVSIKDKNKRIMFDGTIGKKNVLTPDIENVKIVSLESDSDRDVRLEEREKQVKEIAESVAKELEAQKELVAKAEKEKQLRANIEWLITCQNLDPNPGLRVQYARMAINSIFPLYRMRESDPTKYQLIAQAVYEAKKHTGSICQKGADERLERFPSTSDAIEVLSVPVDSGILYMLQNVREPIYYLFLKRN